MSVSVTFGLKLGNMISQAHPETETRMVEAQARTIAAGGLRQRRRHGSLARVLFRGFAAGAEENWSIKGLNMGCQSRYLAKLGYEWGK